MLLFCTAATSSTAQEKKSRSCQFPLEAKPECQSWRVNFSFPAWKLANKSKTIGWINTGSLTSLQDRNEPSCLFSTCLLPDESRWVDVASLFWALRHVYIYSDCIYRLVVSWLWALSRFVHIQRMVFAHKKETWGFMCLLIPDEHYCSLTCTDACDICFFAAQTETVFQSKDCCNARPV